MLHMPTIKPFDKEAVIREASKPGRLVVTAENHTIVGGLGDAVATVFAENKILADFKKIGLPDQYLDAGLLPTLQDKYGITTGAIVRQVKGWLGE